MSGARFQTTLLFLAASLILSLSVPVIFGGFSALAGLTTFPWWAVATAVGMITLGWAFQAGRIALLIRSLGTRLSLVRAYRTVLAGEFASSATPSSTGGPPTYIWLFRQQGLSVEQAAAIYAVDQFTDLVFFVTVLPIAFAFYMFGTGVTHPLPAFVLLLAILIVGISTLWWLIHHHRAVAHWIGRRLRHTRRTRAIRYRAARMLIRFRASVRVLLRMGFRRLLLLYLFCAAHWMLRYGVLPVVLWTIGESQPWSYLFLIQSLLMLGGQLLVLPGGGGGVELGFTAILGTALSPHDLVTTLVVWRFATFYWYLIVGAPVFALTTGEQLRRLFRLRAA